MSGPPSVDGIVAFVVSESEQGSDLNGGGDLGDDVVHAFDPATEALAAVREPASLVVPVGGQVALVFQELAEGFDANGDGDVFDELLSVWDPTTGQVRTLTKHLASGVGARGNALVYRDLENGIVDLNGDGDTADAVLTLYDSGTGQVTSTGLAAGPQVLEPLLSDSWAGVAVSESMQGVDLNQDGDLSDSVAHVVDLVTGQAENLGLAVHSFLFFAGAAADGGTLFLAVPETAQGATDLNGDGDSSDEVLFAHRPDTGSTAASALAMAEPFQFDDATGGGRIAFRVSEAAQGQGDLDGDGDAAGSPVFAFDGLTGATASLGVSTASAFLGGETFLRPVGERVAAILAESEIGLDLTGDGELGLESFLQLLDRTGSPVGVALPVVYGSWGWVVTNGEYLAVPVDELFGVDLNGDGDDGDRVLHVQEATTGRVWNLGLAVSSELRIDSEFLLFAVHENDQGADLDGDGDMTDLVVHHLRLEDLPRD